MISLCVTLLFALQGEIHVTQLKFLCWFYDLPHRNHMGNVLKEHESHPRIQITSSMREDMVLFDRLILCVCYVDSSVCPPETHLSFNLISIRMDLSIKFQ